MAAGELEGRIKNAQFVEGLLGRVNVDPGYVGGTNFLADKYWKAESIAVAAQEKAFAFADQVKAILDQIAVPSELDDLKNYVIADVDLVDPTAAPQPPDRYVLTDTFPTDFPTLLGLKEAPEVDTTYTRPDRPSEINPSIPYTEATYTSENYLQLFTAIYNGFQGGTGISSEIEDLLWERYKERNRVANADAYEKLEKAAGQTGMRFPGGVVSSMIMQHAAEVQRQESTASREIAIYRAELEQKFKEFIISGALDLEKLLVDFHNAKANRSLDKDKAAAQLVVQVYTANIQKYKADWDGVIADLEAQAKAIAAVIEYNRSIVEGFKAENDGIIAQIEGTSKKIGAEVDAYKGEVEGFKAENEAWAQYYRTLTEQQKSQLIRSELVLRQLTSALEGALQHQTSVNSLEEKMLGDVAQVASQALASALNAVNAHIGHSTSSSESIAERIGISGSTTETHSYTEK